MTRPYTEDEWRNEMDEESNTPLMPVLASIAIIGLFALGLGLGSYGLALLIQVLVQ